MAVLRGVGNLGLEKEGIQIAIIFPSIIRPSIHHLSTFPSILRVFPKAPVGLCGV